MTGGKISVIMPAYNARDFVAPAVRSLLRERDVDLEILIVDDGSRDGTTDIVRALAAESAAIRLIEAPHAGVARSRNLGLAGVDAASLYVGFLDADDHNPPGRLARQRAILEAHPEVDFVGGLVQLCEKIDDERSAVVENSRTIVRAAIQLGGFLFRRRVFDVVREFDERFEQGEDIDFFVRLLEAGVPFLTEDKVAVLYRRHGANLTNNAAAARRGIADALRASVARRRESGCAIEVGVLFRQRRAAEEMY